MSSKKKKFQHPIENTNQTAVAFNDKNRLNYAQLIGQERLLEVPLIGYCSCGRARLRIDGITYTYQAGDCLFLLPQSRVNFLQVSDDFYELHVEVGDCFICNLLADTHSLYFRHLKLHPIVALSAEQGSAIKQYIHLILLYINISTHRDLSFYLLTYSFQLKAMGVLLDASSTVGQSKHTYSQQDLMLFQQFLTHLEQHHTRQRNVGYYAKLAQLSTQTFSLLVKEVSGQAPKHWINQMVLGTILELLRDSSLSLTAIAERLHFSSLPVLSLFFKNQMGISPKDYREGL